MRAWVSAFCAAIALLSAPAAARSEPATAPERLNAALAPLLDAGASLIDRGVAADLTDNSPFYVPNYGAPATLLATCGECRRIHVWWRTLDGPEFEVSGPGPVLIAPAPAAFQEAASNIRVRLEIVGGRSDPRRFAFAVVQEGRPRTAQERGFGGMFDDAVWEAAPDLGAGVTLTRTPSAEAMAFFYPPALLRSGRTGRVSLGCVARAAGVLACRPLRQEGASAEFEDAAVRLSTLVRVSETDATGASTAGRRTILPMVFDLR